MNGDRDKTRPAASGRVVQQQKSRKRASKIDMRNVVDICRGVVTSEMIPTSLNSSSRSKILVSLLPPPPPPPQNLNTPAQRCCPVRGKSFKPPPIFGTNYKEFFCVEKNNTLFPCKAMAVHENSKWGDAVEETPVSFVVEIRIHIYPTLQRFPSHTHTHPVPSQSYHIHPLLPITSLRRSTGRKQPCPGHQPGRRRTGQQPCRHRR